MKRVSLILPVLCMVFFTAGCAGRSFNDESKKPISVLEQRKGNFESSRSDSEIFKDILIYLNEEEGEPDYIEARNKLANFIQDYPNSKWNECARALILTTENLLSVQENLHNYSKLLDQANKEKEKMAKDSQSADKIYRSEIFRQQQEIELLKKDITILKRLEIQLDRREKMLK